MIFYNPFSCIYFFCYFCIALSYYCILCVCMCVCVFTIKFCKREKYRNLGVHYPNYTATRYVCILAQLASQHFLHANCT